MRVVIDMQGMQTESRYRGIGRYTSSFVKAVVRNRGDVEIVLVLSDQFPDTIGPIRDAFANDLPREAIRVWSAPGPTRECDAGNSERREIAELTREAFIGTLRPDVVHITSLFEGFVDDAVTSIGALGKGAPVTVMLYDLIPLTNPAQYLEHNQEYRAHYMRKVDWLRRADGFLAISEFSRREGRDILEMDDGMFRNISTAIEPDFVGSELPFAAAAQAIHELSIVEPFVLYTGGSDGRKNLERLIEAYAIVAAANPDRHQLVLAGRMPDGDVARLRAHARAMGLSDVDVVFTGYVSDAQLVLLYRKCACFVFPSWHEGFGLPALEAMACGAPVIGSRTSSIVEVINLDEAMFDPFDVGSIASRISAVLGDSDFAARLRRHGLAQSQRYSWDDTASRALEVWHALAATRQPKKSAAGDCARQRLAMVAPLPPERTGIADYSEALIREFAKLYDIDVIVDQSLVEASLPENVEVRSVEWFGANAGQFDRIVYQVGNSPFHRHVPALINEHPGVAVLHDFFLSSLFGWFEDARVASGAWTRAVYASHGLRAAARKLSDPVAAKTEYPSNFELVSSAIGVIVHSQYARELLKKWYRFEDDVSVIPSLKEVRAQDLKASARASLGLPDDAFVVCTFGFLDVSKMNHFLVDAWANSSLAGDKTCHLVFVGENHGGDYGKRLVREIDSLRAGGRVRITGFVDGAGYRQYLQAADIAVQMRTMSRGETSAAVLDCLSHGIPLIVNANGSFAETPSEGAIILEDRLRREDLCEALERLRGDPRLRESLARGGRAAIAAAHSPKMCAERYSDAIEAAYADARTAWQTRLYSRLGDAVREWAPVDLDDLSARLVVTFPELGSGRRLLLDVTATVATQLHTGIERVARGILAALLRREQPGIRIEPVYLSCQDGVWKYRHARAYSMQVQGENPVPELDDDFVDPRFDDTLLTLDISGAALVSAVDSGLIRRYRDLGVRVYAMLFDLLPIRMPEVFPPGADVGHGQWLDAVATFDGAVCISKAVADDMRAWLQETDKASAARFELLVTHLGSDIGSSLPTSGLPDEGESVLSSLSARPTFLMVGTIEPRKGYAQVIEAFSRLWNEGLEVNLAVVGREGWRGVEGSSRRDIPDVVERLQTHPEAGRRLFWLSDASDEYLDRVYAASTCLVAASFGEGFGLPLIEAARHGLPLLVRDIPVFREVAGTAATYFNASSPAELAMAVRNWLGLYEGGEHPDPSGIAMTTWHEMAAQLEHALMSNNARFT
ncbi:glycosyl transferase family 1 [Lysobacteraceae bacterium NML91-0213]|nr:glycosyl transferase family 1 [Xanthomonadaceae bacterium NML91-0213]